MAIKPRFVTIGWYTEPWDAHIARGRLEAEGIPAFVFHDQHIWANWMNSFLLGRVKLQVYSEDAGRGTEVLEELRAGEFALEPEPEDFCPACGSAALERRVGTVGRALVFSVWFILGLAYPPRKNLSICRACGHRSAE